MLAILQKFFPRDRRTLGVLNLVLIFGILVACLWPFRVPRNTARWIAGGQGIDFGRFGVLLGEKPLAIPGDPAGASSTIELWLKPDLKYEYGSILTIYTPQNARQFNMARWHTGLAIRTASPGDPARNGGAPCYTPDLFLRGKEIFITIASDRAGTSVYANGMLRKITSTFHMTNRMLTGSVVLGTNSTEAETWHGQMRGLAIYGHALNAGQVQADYTSWIEKGHPAEEFSNELLSAYRFDEREGRLLHNMVRGVGELVMPESFVVPAKVVLERPSFDDWSDILQNVIGFMPLGFALCGYLMLSRRWFAAIMMTAVFCGILSLLLELIQVYLPTRDSSMMDVITNFTGGTLGAFCYGLALRILPSTSGRNFTTPARVVPKS
jgi:VanZ family protein